MRVAVFFVSLFCMLLGGGVDVLAVNNFSARFHATHHFKKTTPAKVSIPNSQAVSLSYVNLSEDETFIFEEVEEEEATDWSTRKYRPIIGLHAIAAFQSLVSTTKNCPKARPFFWRPVSYRYILQRTLRI